MKVKLNAAARLAAATPKFPALEKLVGKPNAVKRAFDYHAELLENVDETKAEFDKAEKWAAKPGAAAKWKEMLKNPDEWTSKDAPEDVLDILGYFPPGTRFVPN